MTTKAIGFWITIVALLTMWGTAQVLCTVSDLGVEAGAMRERARLLDNISWGNHALRYWMTVGEVTLLETIDDA